MKKSVFKGAGVAIATPFTKDGINYEEFAKMIEFQIANHTDALVIAGTSGEAATMSEKEHEEIIEFAVKKAAGRVPVIAGTGSNNTAYAVRMTQFAEKVGADAALIVTPYYNKCTQKGLIEHYTYIADHTNIPIIVYSVPSRTGVTVKPETYAALSKHPRIVAVKEASGDLTAILRTRALCGEELDIYSGNDDQIVPILSLGGSGVISVLSNIAPQVAHDICANYFAGDVDEAAKLQTDWEEVISALFMEVNPIPVKAALTMLGYNMGHVRLPLTDMEPEHQEKLRAILQKHKVL